MEDRELLTISEVSHRLKRSVVTLRAWDRRGILVPLRDSSGRRLYAATDVARMAEALGAATAGPGPSDDVAR
jgi:DNA-binding transcriptional MerR regulator